MTTTNPNALQGLSGAELVKLLSPSQIEELSLLKNEVHAEDVCARILKWREESLAIMDKLKINQALSEIGIDRQMIPALLKMSEAALTTMVKARLSERTTNAPASPKPAKRRRFVNPKNPALEWGGRGVRPKWLKEYIASGGNLADLEVKD